MLQANEFLGIVAVSILIYAGFPSNPNELPPSLALRNESQSV
jgi:hypothetical protein